MQFFPILGTTADNFQNAIYAAGDKAADGFESVFSSFIEEGRSDYTGLPPGFSSLEPQTGTLNNETMDGFKKAMSEKGVPKASLDLLDQLAASGAPATVGRIFSALSGNSRGSEALEGDDRMNFMQLMQKLGFDKSEGEELLGMLDDGKSIKAWQRISGKIKELGQGLDMHRSELSALVKGLDLPGGVQERIMNAFGSNDSLTLGSEQLQKLLGSAGQTLADREAAQKMAQAVMRDAMDKTLEQKKIADKTQAVADMRGSRQLDRLETVMRENVLKESDGLLNGKEAGDDSNGLSRLNATGDEKGAGNEQDALSRERQNGKSRAERILATAEDGKARPADGKNSRLAESSLDRMMQRMDIAAVGQQQQPNGAPQAPAQDLNTMARGFRQEIFSQVENGMLQNLQNGSRQLTLQLNPENLGQVTVILSVHQGEVKALIRTEHQESAAALQEQMAELKASLEAQGLKVKELDVQTQLQDNGQANQWEGTREHNLMQDARERDRMARLSQLRRESGSDNRAPVEQESADSAQEYGLHIVA